MGVMEAVDYDEEMMLIDGVMEIYEEISRLDSLKPCKDVNRLFTSLVRLCIPESSIEVAKLGKRVQEKRWRLIELCAEAEGLLESHFSAILGSYPNPLHHLHLFPYYENYLKLGLLEFNALKNSSTTHDADLRLPTRVAFLGSGPLPLSPLVLASFHLPNATFHNYDIDPAANAQAARLVSSDPDLSARLAFRTADVMDLTAADLHNYDLVFLAALVGVHDAQEKTQLLAHLARHMAPGALLLLRSARGARAFLYPVVDPADLRGFEVLNVVHPTDEVINSVIVARKLSCPPVLIPDYLDPPAAAAAAQNNSNLLGPGPNIILPCSKCSDQAVETNFMINPRVNLHAAACIIEELAIEEKLPY